MDIGSKNVGIRNTDSLLESRTTLAIAKRSFQSAAVRQGSAIRTMRSQLTELRSELESFDKLSRTARLVRGGGRAVPAKISGSVSLSLDGDTSSSLSSSAELNTSSTSFSPSSPAWGSSSAPVTLSGEYTGDTTDTLTVEAYRGGRVGGANAIGFNIYGSDGTLLDSVEWASRDPAGTTLTSAGTGLTFSLGAGRINHLDTFEVDVQAGLTIDADATSTLDAASPDFDGASFSAGSFLVNGTTISVDPAADSLQDVLDRITASGAGVSAQLSGDTVTLTADAFGPGAISVGSDTTGLLAALKLDTGIAVDGVDNEREAAMSGVDDFSGVSAGSFTVNGTTISVDPASDSIDDVLDAINASGASVSAQYSDGSVRLVGLSGASVSLSGDTSGWLSSVGLAEGTADPTEGRGSRGSRQAARRLSEAFVDLAEKINALFGPDDELDGAAKVDRITVQSRIRAAIKGVFLDRDQTAKDNELGLTFNFDDEDEAVLTLRRSDVKKLATSMMREPRGVDRVLFGSNQQPGLVQVLDEAIGEADADLAEALGNLGSSLNTTA